MLLGWFAVRRGWIGDSFISGLNKLVFTYFFPATLFVSIYRADLAYAFDPALVGFYVPVGVAFYLLTWAVGARFLSRRQLGTFVQATNRSNYVVIAMAVITFLLGDEALVRTALMVPFVVTVNNIMTATVFLVSGMEQQISTAERMKNVLLGIAKTPMVIAVALGLLANLIGFRMPVVLDRSVYAMADMAAPAVLLGIGGVLRVEKVRRHFKVAAAATLVKNVLIPLCFIVPAVLLGFRGVDLAILAMIALSPTGAMTYAVAVEMGGDGDEAASCLVLSNVVALFTIVLGLTILRVFGLF
ncbi:MAG: AEC family transporter [Oscillospiraceae bacterium]|nr:AEC family transporter [Oscillospiraceae bacterium]